MDDDFDARSIDFEQVMRELDRSLAEHAGCLDEILLEQRVHAARVNPWKATSDGKPLCGNCAVFPVREADSQYRYGFCDACAKMNEHAAEALDLPAIAPYRIMHEGFDVDLELLYEELCGDFPVLDLVNWHESANAMFAWRDHNIALLSKRLGVEGWPDVPRAIWEQPVHDVEHYLAERFVETLTTFVPDFVRMVTEFGEPDFHARALGRAHFGTCPVPPSMPVPQGKWVAVTLESLQPGDIVRVRSNAFEHESLGLKHNGRICEVLRIEGNDAIVESRDSREPQLTGTHYPFRVLERLMPDSDGLAKTDEEANQHDH